MIFQGKHAGTESNINITKNIAKRHIYHSIFAVKNIFLLFLHCVIKEGKSYRASALLDRRAVFSILIKYIIPHKYPSIVNYNSRTALNTVF